MKNLFIIILVIGVGYLGWQEMFSDKQIGTESKSLPIEVNSNNGLTGFFEMDDPRVTNGLFGLNFLNENQVEMLKGKKKLGDTVYYEINDKDVVITHACGVWNMTIKKNGLYHKDMKKYFLKKSD